MPLLLVLAFIGIPLIEIGVFIRVGGLLGLWPTLFIVVATAIAGTSLLRAQGLATLQRFQQSMNSGAFPADELFDGACLLIAGALLLTPGFVTDTLGFGLFIPPIRRALQRLLAQRMTVKGQAGGGQDTPGAGGFRPGTRPGGGPSTIEGEAHEVPEGPSGGDDARHSDTRLDGPPSGTRG